MQGKEDDKGVTNTMYYPKNPKYIQKIEDAGTVVWEALEGETGTELVTLIGKKGLFIILICRHERKEYARHFMKADGIWKNVDDEPPRENQAEVQKPETTKLKTQQNDQPTHCVRREHEPKSHVRTPQPATPGKESREVELDIMDVDTNIFNITHSLDGGIPIKTISPKSGYRLTEIYSLNVPIWTSSGDKSCSLATVHYDDGYPMLASLVLNQGHAYLEYKDGRWKATDKDDFTTKRDSLKSDVYRRGKSALEVRNVGLDITDVDLRVVTMSESFMDGMLVKKTFTPNDGCRLTEVLDMNLSIWKTVDPKEHANSVVIHYDGGFPASLVVDLVNREGKRTLLCYHRKDGRWSGVKEGECEELLRTLQHKASNSGSESQNTASLQAKIIVHEQPKLTPITKRDLEARFTPPKSEYQESSPLSNLRREDYPLEEINLTGKSPPGGNYPQQPDQHEIKKGENEPETSTKALNNEG